MLTRAEHEPAPRPFPPAALPSALLAVELGPAVMADDPCQAAVSAADPPGPSKYYRARYYDPKLGRFISEDPIRWAGGNNFFAYVENNPVLAGDPSGLSAYLYCEVIPSTRGGGIVGGVVLHLTSARHCYIRVICPDKYDVTIELYGPQPGAPNGTPTMKPNDPARNQSAGFSSTIYPRTCSNGCRFEDELINQFKNQPVPTYNSQGPNSNTFAGRIIIGAGGQAVFPGTAFGFDYTGR